MKKILIAGVLSQPFGSWPVSSQSDDGITWDNPVQIFQKGDWPTGIATDGNTVVISNNRGDIAITHDMANFDVLEISGGFGISSLGCHEGDWIAGGTRYYGSPYASYPASSEVAQIYRSPSAYGVWELVWSHSEINSRIHQLRWFQHETTGIWMACGSVGTSGDAWYSIDDGYSWAPVTIPAGVGRITSVSKIEVGSQEYWYWGGNGKLFRSPNLYGNSWAQISIDPADTIVDIKQQGEYVILAGTRNIYSSADGIIFNKWSNEPYVYGGLQQFENDGSYQWLLFARSLLSTKTHWSTSDFVNFNPSNNNIHVTASTLST